MPPILSRLSWCIVASAIYVLGVLVFSDQDLSLAHMRPVAGFWRGKVVLVTGASGGIGEELAVALSAEGAFVVLAARDKEKLKRVQERLVGESSLVVLDMSKPETMTNEAAGILRATPQGRLDVFVNNAGISQRASVMDTTHETELKLMLTNHLGPAALTHALLPALVASGGTIVSINSIAGKLGPPLRAGYAASKHASKGFFESVRSDLTVAGTPIGVTNIMLGSTNTELPRHALRGDGTALQDAAADKNLAQGLDRARVASLVLTASSNGAWEAWIAKPGIEKHIGLYLNQYCPPLYRMLATSAAKKHARQAVAQKKE
mmetsp:Transcript_17278/g.55287  ORF Transcript_17278/g.55287 Transcript_17278/m.55287 type:complete len:320 (+) Transcript_17278:39-998(+)